MALNETETSICNKALALIGEQAINSINDDSSKSARVCKQFYAFTIQSILSEGKWPFATVELPLTRLDVPDYAKEQQYVYAIPNNCALIVGIYTRDTRKRAKTALDWDIRYMPNIRDSVIICNVKPEILDNVADADQDGQVIIEFIQNNSETKTYPANFIRCLVAQLAADICMPITHDAQRWAAMLQYAEQTKAKALQQLYNEDKQDKVAFTDQFTASREEFW